MAILKDILKNFRKELKNTYQAQKNIVDVTEKYIGLLENAESGAGGGITITNLASYSGANPGYSPNTEITLSDDITNYDYLMFTIKYTAHEGFPNCIISVNDLKNVYTTRAYVFYDNTVGYSDVKYVSDTKITTLRANNVFIHDIYGIKI